MDWHRALSMLFCVLTAWLLTLSFSAPLLTAADCIQIHEAAQHIGETKCVTGKVLRVKRGVKGVHFLDFCEDQMACPFTVVIFASGLKDVGDVRRLEGRVIEINGAVKLYDGRAEIILNRISQITGGAAMIPPLPKNYDVENRGHFSAGRLRPAKKPTKTKGKPPATSTYGNDVEGEEPPQ
jgi:DNA/RNA endonuclease YhcR with UshA esterase domain